VAGWRGGSLPSSITMGGARIFAIWGQRWDRAKGMDKAGHVLRASSYTWGPVGAAGGQGRGHRGQLPL